MQQRWITQADPLLKNYIQSILVLDSSNPLKPDDLPVLTNGVPTVLCTSQNKDHRITIFGKSVSSERWTVHDDTKLIAFFFKPFALGATFKLSAQELKDEPVELNCWNPQKAMALAIQLTYARSIDQKTKALHDFILSQIKSNQRDCEIIRYATDTLLQNSNTDVLTQMLKDLNLAERTFQRIFKKYVGITASEYRRICQFQMAFHQLRARQFEKLTDVAYGNGYFDQSHYIRSFKEFTDTTPNDYLHFGLTKK